MIAAAPGIGASSLGAASASPAHALQAGYGTSLADSHAFEQALSSAGGGGAAIVQPQAVQAPGQALQALFRPLDQISTDAASLSTQAAAATAGGQAMSPGDMVALTAKCQQFMFDCQLTANVANRTSDGLQQMFRQQS